MEKEELTQLFNFFREIDKEKFIGRQTYLTEEDAEGTGSEGCGPDFRTSSGKAGKGISGALGGI